MLQLYHSAYFQLAEFECSGTYKENHRILFILIVKTSSTDDLWPDNSVHDNGDRQWRHCT